MSDRAFDLKHTQNQPNMNSNGSFAQLGFSHLSIDNDSVYLIWLMQDLD